MNIKYKFKPIDFILYLFCKGKEQYFREQVDRIHFYALNSYIPSLSVWEKGPVHLFYCYLPQQVGPVSKALNLFSSL